MPVIHPKRLSLNEIIVMEKVKLAEGLEFSRIIHGQMRIKDWNMSSADLLKFTEQIMELGIDTFDNANIYGDYDCEELAGRAMQLKPSLRNEMILVTKCGIKIMSGKFPKQKIQYYDYSYDYIIGEAEKSLRNLRTDRIDVLLLHRPSGLMNPEEVAKAFDKLKKEGKVRYFGVSNFLPHDYSMLQSYTNEKLVTNQVEISPHSITHFENGNMNFFLEKRIKPMAYSPMAWGKLINPTDIKSERIVKVLKQIAGELNVDGIDKVIYSWLLMHPAKIMPINGSGKIDHIRRTTKALYLKMTTEQWTRIYISSGGEPLP
jgi:predicted oxidoreductase